MTLVSSKLAFSATDTLITPELSRTIESLMRKGHIPGLAVAVIKGRQTEITGFGFANLEQEVRVTPNTLFEIGSCSKAFTALAALKLNSEGLLDLDADVSKYLPWFHAKYEGQDCSITIRQLMHHTSGIPFSSISLVKSDTGEHALENTVRRLSGIRLSHLPGTVYEYATVNYDVIGMVIQVVAGRPFGEYLTSALLTPAGLDHTTVGWPAETKAPTIGYKIGFLKPKPYEAPAFCGNYPAGYIVSDAADMSKWLKIQLGLIRSPLDTTIAESHIPDLSVIPTNNISYAYGWMTNAYGKKKIFHDGNNPNFTASIAYLPGDTIGVVILANSNSAYTPAIGDYILNDLAGVKEQVKQPVSDPMDAICSVLCLLLLIYVAGACFISLYKARQIFFLKDHRPKSGIVKIKMAGKAILLGLPYIYGIYLLPDAVAGLTWDMIFVWGPVSFVYAVRLVMLAAGLTYIYYFIILFSPESGRYKNELPLVAFMSILSGLANTMVLFIITKSFYSTIPMRYLLYYFFLAFGLYAIGSKFAQTRMILFTNSIMFDIRSFLLNRIIRTRYQDFGKLKDGRILTTLNNDTAVIANSANLLIGFITNLVTIISAFLYLAFISLFSTMIIVAVILMLAAYYYYISRKARLFIEESRSISNAYVSLLNNLIQGFRELSLHYLKKAGFKKDFVDLNSSFRNTNVIASVKFLNATIVGNSFIIIALGALSIVVPKVFTSIDIMTVISFVMVVLYIIGPVNILLGALQQMTTITVSWDRISGFICDLEGNRKKRLSFWELIGVVSNNGEQDIRDAPGGLPAIQRVEKLEILDLNFTYPSDPAREEKPFKLGPATITVGAGEILFIVGGNGSGKSTLLHLLTGLYVPDSGKIRINGREIPIQELGEYFSVIFSGAHLFKKIYGIPLETKIQLAAELLRKFDLHEKVSIEKTAFSTIDLSGGQKKRLALLKCFLEDRPIFVFDEFAADQDPEFRAFFYTEILADLKMAGKIVIAITHDDHYFHLADRVVRLDYGELKSDVTAFSVAEPNQNKW